MALVSVGAGFGAVGNRTYRMEVIEMPLLPVDWLRALSRSHRNQVKRFRVQVTRFQCLKLLISMSIWAREYQPIY